MKNRKTIKFSLHSNTIRFSSDKSELHQFHNSVLFFLFCFYFCVRKSLVSLFRRGFFALVFLWLERERDSNIFRLYRAPMIFFLLSVISHLFLSICSEMGFLCSFILTGMYTSVCVCMCVCSVHLLPTFRFPNQIHFISIHMQCMRSRGTREFEQKRLCTREKGRIRRREPWR